MPVPSLTLLTRSRSTQVIVDYVRLEKRNAMPRGQLPNEILDLIVAFAMEIDPSFATIAGFSMASYNCRQIAFRHYFSHLHIRKPGHWTTPFKPIHLSKWVKTMNCMVSALLLAPLALQKFRSLQSLELCFYGQSVFRQHENMHVLFENLSADLQRLCLTELAEIDHSMLQNISSRFPSLTSLHLSCGERLDDSCCWSCFEESSTSFTHSPVPYTYSSCLTLINLFKSALKPLAQLQDLQLGVFLSDEDLIQKHIRHAQIHEDEECCTFGPEECRICARMYASWVRQDELQATIELAQYLKQLEKVTWNSFFGKQPHEIQDRKTTIYITRKDGRIKVRRNPW